MSAAPPPPVRARVLLVAGAVLVLLAAGAIQWLTRAGSAPGLVTGGLADAAGSPGAAASPGAGASPGAAVAVPASSVDPSAAPVGPSSVQGWNAVPVAARLADLGPLARPVYDGLEKARAAMDPCFQADEKDQAAHPRAQDRDAWGAAILTLQLEARPGELVVVNAPLQELGTSSPSLVECCEGVLRGFRIPAPAAVPGKRYRLQHQLTP